MKQRIKNTQKGITLVALVITIIILLILAVVSIRIAMDGGLTTKTKNATLEHTLAAEKEAITTGYAAYQMALANKENVTQPTIEEAKVTPKGEDWSVTFTKTNNEYELKKDGTVTLTKRGEESGGTTQKIWKQTDDGITDGEVTLQVGDLVNYQAKLQTITLDSNSKLITDLKTYSGNTDTNNNTPDTVIQDKTMQWKVLDVKNGKIRLIADNPSTSKIYLRGFNGYNNVVYLLDEACDTLYSTNGIGKVQNLKIEDIEEK